MTLTRPDVEKVALLARLKLSDAELAQLTAQLGQIVEYVEQLGELNTDDVAPMHHGHEQTNVFADDQVRASLPREEALANAPKHDGSCYRVPAVLGE